MQLEVLIRASRRSVSPPCPDGHGTNGMDEENAQREAPLFKEAQELLTGTKKTLVQIYGLLKKDAHLAATGAYGDALEEYAEAACYIHYLATKQIATPKQIGVDADVYLPALGDLVGELVRKAVNSVIAGDSTTALEIKDTVSELYAELMLFDWRNTPARKKFDSIKYGLEKLEDLALKIKLK